MGPKKGLNSKGNLRRVQAVEAKAKKEEAKAVAEAKKAKDMEDKYWEEAGDGKKGPAKAQAKKDEQARKAAETAARKAEAKKLADEEAEALAVSAKKAPAANKKAPVSVAKVTAVELRKHQEAEKAALEERLRSNNIAAKREVSEDDYHQQVAVPNVNKKDPDAIDARTVEQALEALDVSDTSEDRHPERRLRAAYAAYEERELPVLKSEKPGLKLQQYKDMVWRQWQRSPENPLVQAGRA